MKWNIFPFSQQSEAFSAKGKQHHTSHLYVQWQDYMMKIQRLPTYTWWSIKVKCISDKCAVLSLLLERVVIINICKFTLPFITTMIQRTYLLGHCHGNLWYLFLGANSPGYPVCMCTYKVHRQPWVCKGSNCVYSGWLWVKILQWSDIQNFSNTALDNNGFPLILFICVNIRSAEWKRIVKNRDS